MQHSLISNYDKNPLPKKIIAWEKTTMTWLDAIKLFYNIFAEPWHTDRYDKEVSN